MALEIIVKVFGKLGIDIFTKELQVMIAIFYSGLHEYLLKCLEIFSLSINLPCAALI